MTIYPPRKRARSVGIGLLGCGTVGGGVLDLLRANAEALADRVGATLEVKRVLVRDLAKARVEASDPGQLTVEPADLLEDPSIDLLVEVIGGEQPAFDLVSAGLRAKKAVVTANKLLLATRGDELFQLAREHRVDLAFEGAIGGGIPIVRVLRDALVSDRVSSIYGILNGTSNYVLTKMLRDGDSMALAIADAQTLGYAEADPSTDVGGFDAAHKLSLLVMIAFGCQVHPDRVVVEGITEIEPIDHRYAARFGYCIKPLAVGKDHGSSVELRVHPAFVPVGSVLANVSGVLNAALVHGEALGPTLVYGRGAGAGPTAVSVVSDIVDAARAVVAGVEGLQTAGLKYRHRDLLPSADMLSGHYLRFRVRDELGVLARLAGTLGEQGVSIQQMVQESPADPKIGAKGGAATVIMTTHRASDGAVSAALKTLRASDYVEQAFRIRIEEV